MPPGSFYCLASPFRGNLFPVIKILTRVGEDIYMSTNLTRAKLTETSGVTMLTQ